MAGSPSRKAKEEFIALLSDAVAKAYPGSKVDRAQLDMSLSFPEPPNGDISSSIAFKLAKIAKKSPAEIAKNVAQKMEAFSYISKVEASNGYVNAFFEEKHYASLVLQSVSHEGHAYGSSNIGEGRKVVAEFPSVNPVKPWHVGHVRSALLGDSISNIMEFCGYRVERTDYIDDLGLQVAEALWSYMETKSEPDKKFDLWLGEQYVKASAMAKEREKEISGILKKMEEGNNDVSRKAREIAERAVRAQYETAFEYGIYHDVLMWESDIVHAKLLESALDLVKTGGIAEVMEEGEYKGCLVVRLEKAKDLAGEFKNPKESVRVLVRSNGVATYAAKDLAFHLWKFGLMDRKFKYKVFLPKQPNQKPLYTTSPDGSEMGFGGGKMIMNTIDASQSPEQQIVRAMIYLLGYKEQAAGYMHIAYGKVGIEGESLKGRSGNWLGEERNYTADDLLRETTQKSLEMVSGSKKISPDADPKAIARAIALSAIKFEYLRIAPERGIMFSWESALNFEANSGPYVMYTYARAKKILKKAGYVHSKQSEGATNEIGRGYDFELIKKMGMAQEIAEKACYETRPNVITDYLLDLSSLFSRFYESMPVIKGEAAREVRLQIVYSLSVVMENMLGLLGIRTVEEM